MERVKTVTQTEMYRQLPSVDELLREPELAQLVEREGRAPVTDAARAELDTLRAEIATGALNAERLQLALSNLTKAVEREVRQALRFSLRPVINATGVILHTNLGRAPLSESAIEHLRTIATRYSNLEFDIASGERGKRDVHAQRLFEQLFAGVRSEPVSTVVVNNNAAAVLLALNELAEGGEVIVSRGELVEIGGSFRIPDVMSKSGAALREVGTTNRTRIADYEKAINERTRLLLRVHRSNFEIVGFTEQPSLQELATLGRKCNIPVMEDLGSGALVDLARFGIHGEPNVYDSLRAGVDIVTYSGDKLLGGPQAGLISGCPELIARIRSNPLFRALRVDKLTYATLEQTLLAYVKQNYDAIPALKMMSLTSEALRTRAESMCRELSKQENLKCEVVATESAIGGGAAPGSALPSFAVAVNVLSVSCDALAAALRSGDPAIVARVEDDLVLLDLRTVLVEQDMAITQALARLSASEQ